MYMFDKRIGPHSEQGARPELKIIRFAPVFHAPFDSGIDSELFKTYSKRFSENSIFDV